MKATPACRSPGIGLFTLFSGGEGEFVVSLDADSGKEVWRHRLDERYTDSQGNGPRSTPTVEDGIVYALGAQGKLAALRAESGETVWTVDLKSTVAARIPQMGGLHFASDRGRPADLRRRRCQRRFSRGARQE